MVNMFIIGVLNTTAKCLGQILPEAIDFIFDTEYRGLFFFVCFFEFFIYRVEWRR